MTRPPYTNTARNAPRPPAPRAGLMAAHTPTSRVAPPPRAPTAGLRALRRMKVPMQVAALRRGDHSFDDWGQAWPIAGHAPQRLELLALLNEDEQLAALRDARFSLTEWCAFARRDPYRCARLGTEFAFIVVTTPEWCER